jgi:hypothetical protein
MKSPDLKERGKDIHDRITSAWFAWNTTMLPKIDESSTDDFAGRQLADHIVPPKTSVVQNAVGTAWLRANGPLQLPSALDCDEMISSLGKGGEVRNYRPLRNYFWRNCPLRRKVGQRSVIEVANACGSTTPAET